MVKNTRARERELFCAESASILDRFVRLTDFERLTMERMARKENDAVAGQKLFGFMSGSLCAIQ